MSDVTETKKEANLLDQIDAIAAGGEVSTKQADVKTLRKNFENYRKSNENSKKKPDDHGAVGKVVAILKEAEKLFDIDENKLYASSKAQSLAKKVNQWCKDNARKNPDGVIKALDFQDEVAKATKRAKATSKKGGSSKASGNAADLNLLEKSLKLLEEQNIAWPAGKEALLETWEKAGDVKDKLGKAASGLYTNLVRAAKDDKCETINYAPDSKTKFQPSALKQALNKGNAAR
jgi:hypothetical protein